MDFSILEKQGSEQLYLQIRRIVLKSIRDQELQPGQKMPSVADIAKQSGVSRMTVRQALKMLMDDGWLYTVSGKGTFIANRTVVEQSLQNLRGWTEEVLSQGFIPSTKLISVDDLPADIRISRELQVSAATPLVRIIRVRYASANPIALEKAHLVSAKFPDIRQMLNQQPSLYQILRDHYGISLVRAVQYLEAGEADKTTAALLDIPLHQPVLVSERITFTSEGEPIEFVTGHHRSGFIRFRTELNSENPTTREVLSSVRAPGESRK